MLYLIPTTFFGHTLLLFQNRAFWGSKTRFGAILSCKVVLKKKELKKTDFQNFFPQTYRRFDLDWKLRSSLLSNFTGAAQELRSHWGNLVPLRQTFFPVMQHFEKPFQDFQRVSWRDDAIIAAPQPSSLSQCMQSLSYSWQKKSLRLIFINKLFLQQMPKKTKL